MWKIADIDPEQTYTMELCQDSQGRRYVRLKASGTEPMNCDVVLETDVVPHELLATRDLERLAREIKLSNGGRFEVDAHNVWFTPEELDMLEESDGAVESVNWCTETPPLLAPY